MVNFRRLGEKAKELVDKRGGTEALKQDAEQLKEIAKGPGSFTDKAKRAAEAIKDPGAAGASGENAAGVEAERAGDAERARAARKVKGEARGKHAHGDAAAGADRGSKSESRRGGDEREV